MKEILTDGTERERFLLVNRVFIPLILRLLFTFLCVYVCHLSLSLSLSLRLVSSPMNDWLPRPSYSRNRIGAFKERFTVHGIRNTKRCGFDFSLFRKESLQQEDFKTH